jgi:serine/threonine protein kinase
MEVIVKGKGKETLEKRHYVTSGGQGSIYFKGNFAYKIYNSPSHIIPEAKIMELKNLSFPNIIKPENILLNTKKNPIGYLMNRIKNSFALCQLFTRAYKERNKIDFDILSKLVLLMKNGISHCHDNGVFIVDLNEMNFLVSNKLDQLYFIDVDNYQTKSYNCMALMDSIRDRHCDYNKKQNNDLTDWFSFGIVAFQMFIGIHPFKGKHPNIKNLDDRMNNNISVFNKDVKMPKTIYPFDVIPEPLKIWFKSIFEDGLRIPPPENFEGSALLQVQYTHKIIGTDKLIIEIFKEFQDKVVEYKYFSNKDVVITDNDILINNKFVKNIKNTDKIIELPCSNNLIAVGLNQKRLDLFNITTGKQIDVNIEINELFEINNRLYGKRDDSIYEIIFIETSTKIFTQLRLVCNILPNATKIFDNVIIQDLMGACYISLFPEEKTHYQIRIKELEKLRLIDAKYSKNILIVITENKGIYTKFIFKFDNTYTNYKCRKIDNIVYSGITFVVLDNGVCSHINEDGYLELFFNKIDKNDIKIIEDDSLSGSILFNMGNQVLSGGGNYLYKVNIKK